MTDNPQAPQPTSPEGIVARLGRALHWTAIAISLLLLFMGIMAVAFPKYGDGYSNLLTCMLLALPIYGVGRFFRYVLAGE